MFFRYWLLLVAVAMWYGITIILYIYPVGSKIAAGVTQRNILALQIGFSESEVERILRVPLSRNGSQHSDLIYATPGLLGAGWEITIEIVGNKLYGIYIEEADLTVYYCTQKKCLGVIRPNVFEKLPM